MHPERIALRAPRAFDGTSFLPDGATVLVRAGRILGVEPFGYDAPSDVEVTTYDGTILPGLIDAHVHLVSDAGIGSLERAGTLSDDELDAVITQSLAEQAAAGVTTVRDLGDVGFRTLGHRERAAAGLPRIVASGPPLTTPGGHCHYLGGVVDGPEAVRHAVAERVERGVDVVKVMASGGLLTMGTDVMGAQFSPADLRLLVEEAHAAGLPVLAHAHSLVGIEHALAAGVDGIEHFTGLTDDGVRLPDDLLDRVARAEVWVGPTLGSDMAVIGQLPEPPPAIKEMAERLGLDVHTFFRERIELAGRFREHGLRVVSGVDSGAAPPKRHGNAAIAVADLVAGGWPVDEAVASATSVAALACGLHEETGRLAPGLAADVLVVDGDLSADVGSLRRPHAVLVRGVAAEC